MKKEMLYPNIEAERSRNGITCIELSKKLGVTRSTYRNWVVGGNIPSRKLEEMSDLFGCSIDYLLGRFDNPPDQQVS